MTENRVENRVEGLNTSPSRRKGRSTALFISLFLACSLSSFGVSPLSLQLSPGDYCPLVMGVHLLQCGL